MIITYHIIHIYHTFDIRFYIGKKKQNWLWFKIKLPNAHKHICVFFHIFLLASSNKTYMMLLGSIPLRS